MQEKLENIFCSKVWKTLLKLRGSDQKGTAKRIRDRSMISSIKPKFDDRFFVDLRVLYKLLD